jgi:hypothetical protein
MKTLKCILFLFTFVGFVLLGCSDKSQSPVEPSTQGTLEKMVRTDFTAHSYPTTNIDPGELKTVDGNLFLRNRKDHLTVESANPFINTTQGIITYNVNADASTAEGHAWGTITFTPDAYPDLEVSGLWNGQITITGPSEWTLICKYVGHIRGGSTNGMQVFWDIVVTYDNPGGLNWESNATGYIQYNEK